MSGAPPSPNFLAAVSAGTWMRAGGHLKMPPAPVTEAPLVPGRRIFRAERRQRAPWSTCEIDLGKFIDLDAMRQELPRSAPESVCAFVRGLRHSVIGAPAYRGVGSAAADDAPRVPCARVGDTHQMPSLRGVRALVGEAAIQAFLAAPCNNTM
jgi:hypothetical protein